MRVFDNSRWGAMNAKQRAVLGMLDHLTDWDKKWIAAIAVTYAHDEVQVLLNKGGDDA